MNAGRALLIVALAALLGGPLAGCLSFLKKDDAPTTTDSNEEVRRLLGDRAAERLESTLSAVPKNYTFPGQVALPSTTTFFNGTIGPEANGGIEDRNDRAGNHYNVVRQMTDVAAHIPAGQPTEVRVTLAYASQPGNSAKCDIAVDLPGTRSAWNPSNNDEFSWKFSVQRMVVNTIGVAGQKHEIGVECANGRITSGMAYSIRMDFSYEADVLTPYHPWAFEVPANASGIILESAKAGGPEHLRAWFMIISPRDELVAFVDFNDIAIPTESVFVPTSEAGQYIFYAHNMTGGFLRLRADAPVADRVVRPLALQENRVVVHTGAAPGLAERNWLHDGSVVTPGGGGQEFTFNVDGTFPLRVDAFVAEGGARTMMTDVKISSPKGLVASLQRVLRMDDERGSLGVSQDQYNRAFHPWNLVKGAYTVQVVNNSPDAGVGHVVTTYAR